jgi:hypothetical protein
MIESRSSMKHCLPKPATLGRTLPVAGETVEGSLTDPKNDPASEIVV